MRVGAWSGPAVGRGGLARPFGEPAGLVYPLSCGGVFPFVTAPCSIPLPASRLGDESIHSEVVPRRRSIRRVR